MNRQPKLKNIKFDQFIIDDRNPRLPQSLHDKSEEVIIEYMLLEASTLELMQAIGENDFFPGEQLLVVKEKEKYRVIEGNRRLIAVKLLNNPEKATVQKSKVDKIYSEAVYKPTDIPCLIFDDASDILKYLGYRHITGIKSWGLLEKVRYLDQMRNDLFSDKSFIQTSRELAKMIGSRVDWVKRALSGFEIYKHIEENGFYRIRDLDETTFFFGYISDCLNRRNIENYLGVDLSTENPVENLNYVNIKKWIHWLFEKNDQNKTRLKGKSNELNMLNSIIGNNEALYAFDEKGYELSKAYELTDDLDSVFEKAIKGSLSSLEQADSLVHKVNHFYVDFEEDIKSMKRISTKIQRTREDIEDEL